jgi:hypothetical protein
VEQTQYGAINPGVPGVRQDPRGGQFPSSPLLNSFLSRLPYAYQIIDAMVQKNDRFKIFQEVAGRRDNVIQNQSLFLHQQQAAQQSAAEGGYVINKDYQAFVYSTIDRDKYRRLMDYRRMAAYPEVSDCLDEICDECIVSDDNGDIIKFYLKGNYSDDTKSMLQKEFNRFAQVYDLENNGWSYFRQFLIEGELFFENVISKEKPHLGIIGAINIPSEQIDPVYQNVQNGIVKGFLLRQETQSTLSNGQKIDAEEVIPLQTQQITYIQSGKWNEFKTFRLPYLETARVPYKKLNLLEDSVIIYRLTRAPERLLFKVYTGAMPPPKAEAYIKRLMQRFWSRKNLDPDTKEVGNLYNPQSMLDTYFFPVDHQGKGTDVTSLNSAAGNLGEIRDLDYFLTKLYKSLKIPVSRMMTPDNPFKDGADITRDELKFARFIMRIQQQMAVGLRESFITHLKLRKLWKEYELREPAIQLEFNVPSTFMAMREQQLLEVKFNNLQQATQNGFAESYAMKYYMGLTIDEMKENREWQRKDAALKWELAQIEQAGPNFRKQIAAQLEGGGAGGGASMGGGDAVDNAIAAATQDAENIPEFGSPDGVDVPGTEDAPDEPPPSQ